MERRSHYVEVNIKGTAVLCDLLAKYGNVKRVILASSRAVYGEGSYRCPNNCCTPDQIEVKRSTEDLDSGNWDPICTACGSSLIPISTTESCGAKPVSVYGLTKKVQEQLFEMALPFLSADVTAFRLQNVYGPGLSRRTPDVGVANILAERVIRGEPLELLEDGEQLRDYIFIDDVARLLAEATLAGPDGSRFDVFNVATGIGLSLRALADMIYSEAGCSPQYSCSGGYRVGDIRHSIGDPTQLSASYDWAPVEPAEGVARLVKWVRRDSIS